VSYEWTSCQCPKCGGAAEYNCVEDIVYCVACRMAARTRRPRPAEERIADAIEKLVSVLVGRKRERAV
jgi:hypothetical protein